MRHWMVPRMWEGGTAWIIGGGPSLPRQFGVPEELIQQVADREKPFTVFSDYFKPIHDRHVIGVNEAYQLGPWISVLYFCDKAFFLRHKEKLLSFHNLKVTETQALPPKDAILHRNIKKLRRDNRYGLSTECDCIRWNRNSGAASINFAVHAGAKRIILLGFDMNKHQDTGRTHWHSVYAKPTRDVVFKRFLVGFPKIAQDAKRRNVEILNASPDSAIPDFKKVTLKDVL